MSDLLWPLPDCTDLRDRLIAAYSDGRGYHDALHLREVLDRIVELGGAANTELVLAAWFHDAVYDGGPDDEERSAEWAVKELAGIGVDAAEVARLVQVTIDHRPDSNDEAGQILSDADLGILAADPERYAAYAAGVREDYDSIPEPDFRAGRRMVLEELAARGRLFHTRHANEHWDAAARANLANEIAALTDSR